MTPEAAAPLDAEVQAACTALAQRLGLGPVAPAVIGRHSNLALHLAPQALVARVATGTSRWRGSLARAQVEVALAQQLVQAGAPVLAPAAPGLAGPHAQGRWIISLWQFYPPQARPADAFEAGRALARCHAVLQDASLSAALPRPAPWGALDELDRLLADPQVQAAASQADLALVYRRAHRCRTRCEALDWPLQWLHGDAHLNNVLATPDGPRWGDWEDAWVGPVEADLAGLLAASRVLGDPAAGPEAALAGWQAVSELPPDPMRLDLAIELRTLYVTGWLWALGAATAKPERRARLSGRLDWLRRLPD